MVIRFQIQLGVCLAVVTAGFINTPDTHASDATEQAYAQQCNAEIGFEMPDFDCNAPSFTDVPVTHPNSGNCDRPNRLNKECDPGSRFRVFKSPVDSFGISRAFVVVHCRKKGNAGNTFGDIAAIQHNVISGATCFYQEGPAPNLSPTVSAPKKAIGNQWNRMTGNESGSGCMSCHDNGAIIRTPYFAQIKQGPNVLPGVGDDSFNNPHTPYYIVGNTNSKAYSVHIEGNLCIACHRMGTSNAGTIGSARDFGLRATETNLLHQYMHEQAKNPDSASSPLWMPPETNSANSSNSNAAIAIAECAKKFTQQGFTGSLPNGCTITRYNVPFGPDACKQGYVWREAFEFDHVCVSPSTRSQAWVDNAQAAARRQPSGGSYGSDTCRQGFVWREADKNNPLMQGASAQSDHVCVLPAVRTQAASDNNAAPGRHISPPL